MVPVQEGSALALRETIADQLAYANEQPGVAPVGLPNLGSEEGEEEAARQVLVDVVPLVDLVRLE